MEENAIVVFDKQVNPAVLFSEKDAIEKLISEIERQARSEVPVVDTAKGRDAIKSLAHKIARSKTALDDMGKAIVTPLKEKAKKVDAERKIIRDRLDTLKEEIRKPVTDFEKAEKERIQKHHDGIERMESLSVSVNGFGSLLTSSEIESRIADIESTEMGECWDEFAGSAARAKDGCLSKLKTFLVAAKQREAEQAELDRLRKEQEEREKREYEERLKREAAEQAKREAEERAAREKADLERREREAQEAAERAERERIAAEERAKIEAENAKKRAEEEKQRAVQEAERKAREEAERCENERLAKEAADKAKRECIAMNKTHQKEINNAALVCFEQSGIDSEVAKTVIRLIASGVIDYITINY